MGDLQPQTREDNGTVEYAVECRTQSLQPGLRNRLPTSTLAAAMDHAQNAPCGPHRVVQRTVTPWQPVDDDTSTDAAPDLCGLCGVRQPKPGQTACTSCA